MAGTRYEDRAKALDFAIKLSEPGEPMSAVLERARKFAGYLAGTEDPEIPKEVVTDAPPSDKTFSEIEQERETEATGGENWRAQRGLD